MPADSLDFVLGKIQEGVTTGAHGSIPPGQARWLAAAHVIPSAGKLRLVVDHHDLNAACQAATCRYESIDDLVQLLTPTSWLFSCDLVAAYHHCRVAPQHRKYTGFHLALPARGPNGELVPLQHGGYYVFPSDLQPQERARTQSALSAYYSSGSPQPRQRSPEDPAAPPLLPIPLHARTHAHTHREEPLYQVVELCAYALNFGARASPLVFTKHMRALVKYLRQHAIGVVIYLDDLAFVIEGSQAAALRARDFVEKTLCRAGLQRHPSKGQFQVPSQVLHDHLGYEVNIPLNLLRVPERRCHTIRRLALALRGEAARNRRLVPTRLLQQFTGTACSTSRAVRNARFHLRSLYDCTALTRPHSRLSRTALQDLEVWAHFQYDSQLNGVPLFTSPTSRALYTDASGGVGWGGVLPPLPVQERLCRAHAAAPHEPSTALHHRAGVELPADLWRTSANEAGLWDADLLPLHINFKELRAVHRSLLAWRSDLQGHRVLLFCDNTTVVQLLRKGTSRSPLLMAELRQVWRLLIDMQVDLVPVYIPSGDNPADFPSRHSQRAEWTFRAGMRATLSRLSSCAFTLDPFARPATAMAPTYCSLRAGERCIANDGMCVSWRHQHVFLNPPWHLFHRVLRKIIEDAATGVLIVPHWPSQSWWPLVLRLRARWVYLPPPKCCVLPCTRHKVDPFAHGTTRLIALAFNGTRGWKRGTRV